jgi:hypothetical protein
MSELEARKAIEAYFEAFNAQDEEAMRGRLHFPFAWIVNHRVRPVATAAEFEAPTKILIRSEGWARSEVDFIEIVQAWDEKVHAKLAYSRFRADGTRYATHECLWILTKVDDHWGVQLMSLHIPD